MPRDCGGGLGTGCAVVSRDCAGRRVFCRTGGSVTQPRQRARDRLRDSCALPIAARSSDASEANARHRHCLASSQGHAQNLHARIPACSSRQSSLESKASATDKSPISLRTASHSHFPKIGMGRFLWQRNAMFDAGRFRIWRGSKQDAERGLLTGTPSKTPDEAWSETDIFARTDSQRSWQDIAQMYSRRALGRQKGVSQARYSRDVFPSIIFHRFSRLKTYIRRLSCQKQAIRACISAISCHEEAFLASERPSRMHDSHFLPPDSHSLPLLDAQPPLHTEHLAALSWQQLSPTPLSLSSRGAFSRLVMAAFLLRSPFRSRLRRAFHRARNH